MHGRHEIKADESVVAPGDNGQHHLQFATYTEQIPPRHPTRVQVIEGLRSLRISEQSGMHANSMSIVRERGRDLPTVVV